MIASIWLLSAVLLFAASAAYGGHAFAELYPAPSSGTVHTVAPADFALSGAGFPHSCEAVICPGYEREDTSDRQFIKYEISTSTVADGDTVVFADGTYDLYGPIVIRHANLTISSDDGSGVLIRSTDNKGLVFRNHGDVSGLEIRGFYMASADTTRLAPARNFGMIFIEGTAGLDGIRILNNTFQGDKQNGVRIGSHDRSSLFTNVEIRDNTFEIIPADRTPIHLSNAEVTLFANTFERSDYVHLDGDGSLADLYNLYPGKPDRAPSVTAPPPVELEATGPLTAVTPERLGIATARDDRDQFPVITNDSPGSFAVGNHTVTWTATDSVGNSGTATQSVTIRDTTPPVITLTGDIKVTVEIGVTHEELLSAVAATCTDLVDGDLLITSNGVVDTDTPGKYVVEQSCTDTAGNPASVTRTVAVVASQPLQQPTDLGIVRSYDMGNGWHMTTINWTEPAQPPVSGYEVTVTGSNGTLLPLSQFEIMVLYTNRSDGSYSHHMAVYNMDGSRNPQDDFDMPRNITMDIHDNIIYMPTSIGYGLYDIDGTHIRDIASYDKWTSDFEIRDGNEIWGIHRDRMLVYDMNKPVYDKDGNVNDQLIDSINLDGHHGDSNIGFAYLDDILYVQSREFIPGAPPLDAYVFAYELDGTYLPDKSFDPSGNNVRYTADAEERTGTLWIPQSDYSMAVYSSSDPDNAPSRVFSIPVAIGQFSLTTTVVSETIAVPTGTNSTAYYYGEGNGSFVPQEQISLTSSAVYYYHAPANETVTHAVRSVGPSTDPPTTITTRGGTPVLPTVQVFHDTFDAGLDTWTYRERPYDLFNSMFCDDGAAGPYVLAHSGENGGSAHVGRTNGTDPCWFGSAGLARTFDVPAGYGGGDLNVTLGYMTRADFGGTSLVEILCLLLFDICAGGQEDASGRATAAAARDVPSGPLLGRHANNLFYAVTDSAGNDLAGGRLFPDGTAAAASWNTATVTVPSLDASSCPCEITVHTSDLDWDVTNKRFHIDDVNATMTAP